MTSCCCRYRALPTKRRSRPQVRGCSAFVIRSSAIGRPSSARSAAWLSSSRRRRRIRSISPGGGRSWTSGHLIDDRLLLLSLHDNGERYKGMTALTGIDERDPTADRRLVEFCLALRPEHLLYRGEPRPLAREAFSDRINPQVFDFAVR